MGPQGERMDRGQLNVFRSARPGPRQWHLPSRTLASSLRTCTLIARPSATAASVRSAFRRTQPAAPNTSADLRFGG